MRRERMWRILLPTVFILFFSSVALSEHGKKIDPTTDKEESRWVDKDTIRTTLTSGTGLASLREKLKQLDIPFHPAEFVRQIEQGERDTVGLFLLAGMSPNTTDEDGTPALILAIRNDELEIVRLLVHKAPEVNAFAGLFLETIDINARDKEGQTALITAAKNGQIDIAAFLLKEDVDINGRNMNGETALMLAAEHGHTTIVILLLKEGAEVNAKRMDGGTAFSLATANNEWKIVELLSQNSPDAAFKARQREWIRQQKKQSPSSVFIPLSWIDIEEDEFVTENFYVTIMRPGLKLTGYQQIEVDSEGVTRNDWIEFDPLKEAPPYPITASMIINSAGKFNCISERVKDALGTQIDLSYSEAAFLNLALVFGNHGVQGIDLIFHGNRYGSIESIARIDFLGEETSIILDKPFIQNRFVACWEYYIENELTPKLDSLLNVDGLCEHLNSCRPHPSVDIRFGRELLDKIPHRLDEDHRVLILW